jgi:II/X family phage/plasmid replication protein
MGTLSHGETHLAPASLLAGVQKTPSEALASAGSCLLDWLSLRYDRTDSEPLWVRQQWDAFGDRILRVKASGELVWQSSAWDSVRSDTHGVVVKVSPTAVFVQGSPARAMGNGCNVFGAPGRDDVVSCFRAMLAAAAAGTGLHLPADYRRWKLTRADVTANLALGNLAEVRVALAYLRGLEGGRYRVSQQAGDTVYWSHRSRLRSGKAYAKGPHLAYELKRAAKLERVGVSASGDVLANEPRVTLRSTAERGVYDPERIALAGRLLRLELTLGAQWFRERATRQWYDMSAVEWSREWDSYFGRMFGDGIELQDSAMQHIDSFERAVETARRNGERSLANITNAQARAAFRTWQLIRAVGWQEARDSTTRPTWYRHCKVMKAAGVRDLDIAHGRVVPMRTRLLELRPVGSWSELRAA